jgi:alpha-mannosidase
LVRQGLYGQLTFERLFGHPAKIGTNPDSFGHPASLPQILKKQGMNTYVFMRPQRFEQELPAELFRWKGIDGSEVLAYHIQESYNMGGGDIQKRMERTLKEYENQPVNEFMVFYGVGDHGGGPTKENLKWIDAVIRNDSAPDMRYSSTENYFRDINILNELPVLDDDLQILARGCYTSESSIKKFNRYAEAALSVAEKISTIGSVCWDVIYPKFELTNAWLKVLFLQFHDSLAGTSLGEHSATASEGYGYALEVAHNETAMSLQKLEWQIPSEDANSLYWIVFNPHAWAVDGYTGNDCHSSWVQNSVVFDENGNVLPHQWTMPSSLNGRSRLLTKVTVPPMGYRQIRLTKREAPKSTDFVKAGEQTLENEFYLIRFFENGSIGVTNKETGKEIFDNAGEGCRAIVLKDTSDTWSHNVHSYKDEIGSFGNAGFKIIENGSQRATIRVSSSYGKSKLDIDWSIYAGSRNIEAKVTLDWHEHHKLLKFSFPVNVISPQVTYEIPYGNKERKISGEEEPGQRWISMNGTSNGAIYGLTVMNDAKYGYNVQGNDMRITIVRSTPFAHHDPVRFDNEQEYYWMDQGLQTMRMLLIPHKDTWRENNIIHIAEEFMSPLESTAQGIHGGTMPKSKSFLSVNNPNVVVTTVKKSESDDNVIIRCVELSGKAGNVEIDMSFLGTRWVGSIKPYEIKTLLVNKKNKKISEVNLLEK